MAPRKPLHPDCIGGIWCEVDGHVTTTRRGNRWTVAHIKLTAGQRETLEERRAAKRAAVKSSS